MDPLEQATLTFAQVREHLLDVRRAHIAHARWLRAVRSHLPPEIAPHVRDLDAAFQAVIVAVERCTGCNAWNGA